MIRVISGDHERSALDFQKHYRFDMVCLMDTDMSFQTKYSRGGWPFLMLVDPKGNVVHKVTSLVDREAAMLETLQRMRATTEAPAIETIDGTTYSTETLRREGNSGVTEVCQRFSSLAAGQDGRLFLVYSATAESNDDVWLRLWDGQQWSTDQPLAATTADEYNGSVVVSADGRPWFCWTSNADSDHYNIFVTNLERVNEGKAPIRITDASDDAMYGRLACDDSGTLWIAYYKWQKNQTGISRDKEVFVRRLKDGVLSEEVQVSPTDVPAYEDHTDPAITLVDGKALVAWSWDFHKPTGYTQDAESPTIFLRTIDEELNPGKPFHASNRNIDMAPILAARDDAAWCTWDSLGRAGNVMSKTLFVRRVTSQACADKPVAIASDLQHLCSPCLVFGLNGQAAIIWCQKQRNGQWELKRASCDDGDTWSQPETLIDEGNPRYCAATVDTHGDLWVSYTIDTSQGREVQVTRLGRLD